jgi:hypothetical protein
VNDVEELLDALEAPLAFQRDERVASLRAGVEPPPRHRGDRVRDVSDFVNHEAGLAQKALVLPDGGEQEETDRAACADLVFRQLFGHDDRIGEEQPSLRSKDAMPLPQYVRAPGEVVDRVVAEDRIERVVPEGQATTGVRRRKRDARGVTPLPPRGGLERERIDVDPDAHRAGVRGHAARHAARSTRHLQGRLSGSELEKTKPLARFLERDPARLPQVLSVGVPAHRELRAGGEVTILGVVEIGFCAHRSLRRRDSESPDR